MTSIYGASQRGTSHMHYGVPNQDAISYLTMYDFDVMMVLDGVSLNTKGEFSKSHLASHFVKREAIKFLKAGAKKGMSIKDLERVIKLCFIYVSKRLEIFVKAYGDKYHESTNINDYQTTFTLLIHKKGKFAYGNAGDAGIIYLNDKGDINFITNSIKANTFGSFVEPLCVKESWQFGTYEERPVTFILMATDGIFDALIPNKHSQYINYNLLNRFIDKDIINGRNKDHKLKKVLVKLDKRVTGDDKSVVILRNQTVKLFKEETLDDIKEREKAYIQALNKLLSQM